ncbi:SDR family NAD(P)-dependent oxidoreductase [Amycolatopsis sp. NPDC051102]|uniref:SDR family oxidoreductase n=1 Tax=Amycolatopsis sp. NPDC051102 TaxID=3155163 RepID=UPI00344A76CE
MNSRNISTVLVIGASGFVGRHAVAELLEKGYRVRCAARRPEAVADLAARGCEVVKADMTDAGSMVRALDSVDAVFVCVHTLLPQAGGTDSSPDFVETELEGLRNIVAGCRANDVGRIVYVTFLGVRPDAENAWTRGRWKAEQYLLDSGLDATIFRPGMIVGDGGRGFGVLMSRARRPVAVLLGNGKRHFQHIAVTDLAYYLVASLDQPETFGHAFDVGGDETLSYNQMVDLAAGVLGRGRTVKLHFPRWPLTLAAPLLERISRMPRGSLRAFLQGLDTDSVGDPRPIRRILQRPPLTFAEAVKQAAGESGK